MSRACGHDHKNASTPSACRLLEAEEVVESTKTSCFGRRERNQYNQHKTCQQPKQPKNISRRKFQVQNQNFNDESGKTCTRPILKQNLKKITIDKMNRRIFEAVSSGSAIFKNQLINKYRISIEIFP